MEGVTPKREGALQRAVNRQHGGSPARHGLQGANFGGLALSANGKHIRSAEKVRAVAACVSTACTKIVRRAAGVG